MYYILVGIIVLGAFTAMYAAAWWYQQHVVSAVQHLRLVESKQAMDNIYNCLNSYYDSQTRQVVFPGKVVWVKNPHYPDCQNVMEREHISGATRYWHGGRCGYGEGDRVNADLNDIIALPSSCYVKVIRATVYGQTVTIPLATIYG